MLGDVYFGIIFGRRVKLLLLMKILIIVTHFNSITQLKRSELCLKITMTALSSQLAGSSEHIICGKKAADEIVPVPTNTFASRGEGSTTEQSPTPQTTI